MTEPRADVPSTSGSLGLSLFLCAAILLAAGSLSFITFNTEPETKKAGATRTSAMLVEVLAVHKADHRPHLDAVGTVRPSQDVTLRPQVSGRVVSITDAFAPGSDVTRGDVLLEIEASDFENALAVSKSAVRQAEAELALERGRHEAARAEYEFLEQKIPEGNRALMLREPQLEAAEARVAAAQAAASQARLDLRRATVRAPFDAHVLRRDAHVGSQVDTSADLGRLVGLQAHWIAIDLPREKLPWIDLPRGEEQGAQVSVRSRTWPEGVHREATLFRLLGSLDEGTRMARLLATLPDPLARERPGEPPLLIGEFLEVSVQGKPLEGSVRLERAYVRDGERVWLMRPDETLEIRDVEVALYDETHAYITRGLEEGERVVITGISTPVDGAPLRLSDQGADSGGSGE